MTNECGSPSDEVFYCPLMGIYAQNTLPGALETEMEWFRWVRTRNGAAVGGLFTGPSIRCGWDSERIRC